MTDRNIYQYIDNSGEFIPLLTKPNKDGSYSVVGGQVETEDCVIANGQSLSSAINLDGRVLSRIDMPTLWTTAGLSFQVSTDNVTYRNLYDSLGTEVTATVSGGTAVLMSASDWTGVQYLKIRSGTSSTPVAQGAERTITLVVWR